MVAQILPALHSINFVDKPTPPVERFVSMRENAGRPVTIVYLPDEDEDENEYEDENEDAYVDKYSAQLASLFRLNS